MILYAKNIKIKRLKENFYPSFSYSAKHFQTSLQVKVTTAKQGRVEGHLQQPPTGSEGDSRAKKHGNYFLIVPVVQGK